MNKMTLTPELTAALSGFLDREGLENRIDLLNSIEDHYFDDDSGEPAEVLDTLRCLRYLKQDLKKILDATLKTEEP